MTTLAAAKPRDYLLADMNDMPAVAADFIHEGSAVGDNGSGYGRPLAAGDPFRGFCLSDCDNTDGAAGAKRVHLRKSGRVQLAIAALAITDVGKPVYASDDDTFVLTASTNSYIGRVSAFVSAGIGFVDFDADRGSLGAITALTDSSGGTAGDVIAAISGTYVQAEVRNAIATLADRINKLAAQLK